MKKATYIDDSNTMAVISLFGLGLIIYSFYHIGKNSSLTDSSKMVALGVRG